MYTPPIVALWRLTTSVYAEFMHLSEQLETIDPHSDEAEELRDAIRSLPNYPADYNKELGDIGMELIATPYSMLGGSIH